MLASQTPESVSGNPPISSVTDARGGKAPVAKSEKPKAKRRLAGVKSILPLNKKEKLELAKCKKDAPAKKQLLSKKERAEFAECEKIIAGGVKTFYEVGKALQKVQAGKLYRENFLTFEQYLSQKWDLSTTYGHGMIQAAETMDHLSAIADKRPENEAQVRPLVSLAPEQKVDAWKAVIKAAGKSNITAKLVKATVAQLFPKTDAKALALQQRVKAAELLPAVSEYHLGEVQSLRGLLEGQTARAFIFSGETSELEEAIKAVGVRMAPISSIFVFADFRDEPAKSRILEDAGFAVRGRAIWYEGINERVAPKDPGSTHRSILWATKGNPLLEGSHEFRLADPLVYRRDSDVAGALPVRLLSDLINVSTVPNELVVFSGDRGASGVIAAKRLNRRVIGVEADPTQHALGRERIAREFTAPKNHDEAIAQYIAPNVETAAANVVAVSPVQIPVPTEGAIGVQGVQP